MSHLVTLVNLTLPVIEEDHSANPENPQVYDIFRSPWDCGGTLENELLLLDGEEYDVAFGKANAQDEQFWYY